MNSENDFTIPTESEEKFKLPFLRFTVKSLEESLSLIK